MNANELTSADVPAPNQCPVCTLNWNLELHSWYYKQCMYNFMIILVAIVLGEVQLTQA